MSNFKKMVRARMAKTGEAYSTAARHVRSQAPASHQAARRAPKASVACGACGKVILKGEIHDSAACWDLVPCVGCGEVCGYDYTRLHRVCKGCGHKRDMV